MRQPNRFIIHAIAATAFMAAMAQGCADGRIADPEADRARLVSSITGVERLTLASMRVTKMATIDDLKLSSAKGVRQTAAALLDAVKIGDRKAAYSYDTYLRAYIDLSRMDPDDITLDPERHSASIVLPPVITEFDGRDATIREDHYRVSGLRSDISASERALLKEKMSEHLRQEVENDPEFRDRLLETARRKATDYFRRMLEASGYTDITITFRQS